MLSKARLKNFEICKEKHVFCINKYSQKYFPCVSKTFPVLQQNSLCFPCLEKVRTKFPVFPVPWPPCVMEVSHAIRLYRQGLERNATDLRNLDLDSI